MLSFSFRKLASCWLLLVVGLTACQSTLGAAPTRVPALPTEDEFETLLQSFTPIPTVVIPSDTPTSAPTQTLTPMPAATFTETDVTLSTETKPVATSVLPAPTGIPGAASPQPVSPALLRIEHYLLERPIAQEANLTHWLDRTYPYGSTQLGEREVHTGVEFVNRRFTPILAAAAGRVFFAGDDSATQFGPRFDYYGNLVVLAHSFTAPDGQAVYTLYAHMQDIAVQTGQQIEAGDRLGRVGDSGIAVGPHLHFEVRVGPPHDIANTRNPDLWIKPYSNHGTLAGRVHEPEQVQNGVILVRSADRTRETYIYANERVNSAATWNENFTLGDLPVGSYDVIISDDLGRIQFRERIIIESGRTTWIDIAWE